MPKFLLCLLFTVGLSGCGDLPVQSSDHLRVYVSIPPQAHLLEEIVGNAGEIHVLLPKGASHESYEPKPSQLRELAQASLYVRMGLPFENAVWDKIRATNKAMRVVEPPMSVEVHGDHGHAHDHEGGDPHTWMNPAVMRAQVGAAAEALADIAPDHAVEFRTKAREVQRRLDGLHDELKTILEPVRGRTFWVYHPSWGHLAAEYGLHQRAIEQEGKEMGAQGLAQLVAEAKRDKVRVIFVDPSVSSRNAGVIAKEIGANVVTLDPVRGDYFANLRETANALAEALQ